MLPGWSGYAKLIVFSKGVVAITTMLIMNRQERMMTRGMFIFTLNILFSRKMKPIIKRISAIANGKNTGNCKSLGAAGSLTPPRNKQIDVP